jgi:L-ornithine N5-monooxygenase
MSGPAIEPELRRPAVSLLGIGFGPANLALAIAMLERGHRPPRFLERQPCFGWHRGMLIDDATMQVSFLKDLVTMRNPTSAFSFVSYLHEAGQLVDFINHKTLFPLRIEFHEYLSWAAERVGDVVDYGHEVINVRPRWTEDGELCGFAVVAVAGGQRTVTHTRDVVVAAGLEPVLPPGIQRSEHVWHASQLLPRAEQLATRCCEPRRLVVVGAGQSAAEAVAYLHREFPAAEVCSVFARFGYSPSDDSPFANRVFDPDAAALFHGAPREVKRSLLDYHRNTNYSVVDAELIDQLYREHYRERLRGTERLRILPVSRLASCHDAGDEVDVVIECLATGEITAMRADAVVFATGYRPIDPLMLLGAAGELCARDQDGLACVGRDHSLELTVPSTATIYVQGATEHAFGLGSTLLSMAALRAGEIADAVAASQRHVAPAAT